MTDYFDFHFELVDEIETRGQGVTQVWKDERTGEYFSTYIWEKRLRITDPTPYLRLTRDDAYAQVNKMV